MNDLPPISPHRTIDTLKKVKSIGFSSNKLDYLGLLLANKKKLKTEFQLWIDCLAGDKKALKEMNKYCNMDVLLLEEVYIAIRPWMKLHPNLAVFDGKCPVCGSGHLEKNGKYHSTNTNLYQSLKCQDCGAYSRKSSGVVCAKKRKKLARSL